MSNDITLPGTGAVVNTRQQSDLSHNQVVEVDGELLTTLQSLTLALNNISKSIGLMMPDASGRMRVSLDAATNTGSIGNIGTVTTVTGVTTVTNVTAVASLTNQISIGSFNANDQVPALMNTAVRLNRQLITVS
jgi:hypothetical protein